MNSFFDTFYYLWKNIDKSILLIILNLFLLGLFFSLVSTSIIASDKLNTNSYYFFKTFSFCYNWDDYNLCVFFTKSKCLT